VSAGAGPRASHVYILLAVHSAPECAPLPQDALQALGLIIAVLGSIFFGIATPTETAGIGALGALLLALPTAS
jgi:TRAP-type mannitol/chloroaromatic compound transport system permease large subunit